MQRQTRYMARTNSMARGKRSLEGDEDQQPERKRPALASVIIEALKVDSLQKLCSSLEPILRRVVSEEVERALAKLGPPRLNGSYKTWTMMNVRWCCIPYQFGLGFRGSIMFSLCSLHQLPNGIAMLKSVDSIREVCDLRKITPYVT